MDGRWSKPDHKSSLCHYVTGELKINMGIIFKAQGLVRRMTFALTVFKKFTVQKNSNLNALRSKGALAIRRIFSLVDMITNKEFSYCPYIIKIGMVRQ